MISRISDFKIAEFLIRGLCRRYKSTFIDMPIEFGSSTGFDEKKISVSKSERLSKTLFQIISTYVMNMGQIDSSTQSITNEDKISLINYTIAIVREMSYAKDSVPDAFMNESTLIRLNRFPMVWIILRDVICPAFDIPIKNVKVIAAKSSMLDVSCYIEKNTEDSFIFLNNSIENAGCRFGFLLFEAIRSQGVDPKGIIGSVMSNAELWEKVSGFSKAALVDSPIINDFISILSMLSGQKDHDQFLEKEASSKWNNKIGLWSQSQSPNLWWHVGLIEKMLEPDRAPDWTGYFTSKHFTDELWEKVEAEKEKRGLDELPMELLLRIQSEEFKQRPDLIIQGLLADNRVW